jgi:DNA-directed RNA polymerase specialized sigma subunit
MIEMTYFQGKTLTEAAERLGKSKSWASRLHTRILEKLSRKLSAQGIC